MWIRVSEQRRRSAEEDACLDADVCDDRCGGMIGEGRAALMGVKPAKQADEGDGGRYCDGGAARGGVASPGEAEEAVLLGT